MRKFVSLGLLLVTSVGSSAAKADMYCEYMSPLGPKWLCESTFEQNGMWTSVHMTLTIIQPAWHWARNAKCNTPESPAHSVSFFVVVGGFGITETIDTFDCGQSI
jgi:hypothetical protein